MGIFIIWRSNVCISFEIVRYLSVDRNFFDRRRCDDYWHSFFSWNPTALGTQRATHSKFATFSSIFFYFACVPMSLSQTQVVSNFHARALVCSFQLVSVLVRFRLTNMVHFWAKFQCVKMSASPMISIKTYVSGDEYDIFFPLWHMHACYLVSHSEQGKKTNQAHT